MKVFCESFLQWFNTSAADGHLVALEKLYLKDVDVVNNAISKDMLIAFKASVSNLQKLRIVEL